tara:strand:- start:308 stop:3244 length:2937 start_codon:yes stop_codon:yes gene_type:complete
MTGLSPTEQKFEKYIASHLISLNYSSKDFSEYDRKLCLIKQQVIHFIQTTQQEKWKALQKIYGDNTEKNVLLRISSEISKRGIVDVLRKQVKDRGQYLDLCYFKPKSDLNPDHLKLYKQNQFTVVRQLHFSTKNEKSIDMGLFLNGLPIATIELKNQFTGQNYKDSEKQYKGRDQKEPLLQFMRCMVHFCVDNNNVSMSTRLSGQKTLFFPFNRDLVNPEVKKGYRTKYFWEEILTPDSLLDIIENFVHLSKPQEILFNEKTGKIDVKTKEVLIFPRYHQLDLIRNFRRQIKDDGVGQNYLVQHTTGSGKSYSIGWLSHTLTSFYKDDGDTKRLFDTIIVVSDRTVLDDQLRNTIDSLSPTRGVVNDQKLKSSELKEYLEEGKDIIVATIQSFPFISKEIAFLGDKKFAVIIDEVHSSQSGELSKELKKSLSKTDDDDEFDYEKMLVDEIQSRGRQKHISFFGFTGTPKPKTLELFGTKTQDGEFIPFHIYSMYQSIHEGFTLDVLQNYTTYRRFFKIKKIQEDDKEIPSGKGTLELIRYVDAHPTSIENKVQIILDHWVNKGSKEIQGKSRGMIVTPSRKHCVWYSKEITKQLLERGLDYRCLVGFSGEVLDKGKKYTESICNFDVGHKGDVPLGLKDPKYRLLVVANKFQTGFDEPLLQSMYVDKKLGGVQCIQTLSRLNRTTKGKTHTFVLDFVNEPEEIRESFQRFYQSTILEGETDPNRLYDFQREIYEYHLYTNGDVDRFCKIFFSPNRDEGDLHPEIDRVIDKFSAIEDEEKREFYRSRVQTFIRMYGYLSQIIDFTDIELEKSFLFLKYLNKKLPKRVQDRFNISDLIDLDSLRIQKVHEGIGELINQDANVLPPRFDPSSFQEPEYDLLSEIIKQVNIQHGHNLTEEDRIDLSRLSEKLDNDLDVKKYMKGNNTEVNKQNYFNQRCDEMILDEVDSNLDFYKKMDENRSVKNMIFRLLYENYRSKIVNK